MPSFPRGAVSLPHQTVHWTLPLSEEKDVASSAASLRRASALFWLYSNVMVHICTCFKCSLLKKSFRVSGKITNNIRLFKEKGRKNGESKEFFLECGGDITGTRTRK